MLFKNPRKLLSEAASADLLNPEVSDEVKDVIEELEDVLTNNIEEVDDKDKTTNGGIPVVAESVALMEASAAYGNAKYLVKFEDVVAVMESEAEAAATEAMEEPGQAPSAEEVAAHEPEPENVIDDIAAKNGVEPEQVAVVITAESFRRVARAALLESKAGKCAENTEECKKNLRLAKKMKEHGIKMVVADKKK